MSLNVLSNPDPIWDQKWNYMDPLDLHKIKLQTFDFKNRFESIKYGVGCARTKNRNYKFDNYKVNIKKINTIFRFSRIF